MTVDRGWRHAPPALPHARRIHRTGKHTRPPAVPERPTIATPETARSASAQRLTRRAAGSDNKGGVARLPMIIRQRTEKASSRGIDKAVHGVKGATHRR